MEDYSTWAIDIENVIFSMVKAKTVKQLSVNYPDIEYTMDDSLRTNPTFPTVYFHFLPSVERGADLQGQSINGIKITVDVKVICSNKQGIQATKNIQKEILMAFKEMRFECKLPQIEEDSKDVKISTARYSRTIGQGTTL